MFPPTPGYDQQTLAYLQAWRQFLEQWAAMLPPLPLPTPPWMWPMAPSMPFAGQPMSPLVPPMPPLMPPPPAAAPPAPPAPTDYSQHLFSYLQAWRQYLEQMAGGAPESSRASTPQQPTGKNGAGDDDGKPRGPSNGRGGKSGATSGAGKGSTAPWPPQQIDVQPQTYGGSQDVSIDVGGQASPLVDVPPTSHYQSEFRLPEPPTGPNVSGPEQMQLLNPPDYAFGYLDRTSPGVLPAGASVTTAGPQAGFASEAPQLPMNSPFSAMMERVEPTELPAAAPKSLFAVTDTPREG
jgi:hypothetical protein